MNIYNIHPIYEDGFILNIVKQKQLQDNKKNNGYSCVVLENKPTLKIKPSMFIDYIRGDNDRSRK